MVFWSLGSWDLDQMDHDRSAYLVLICGVGCYDGGVKITFVNDSHILVIYALGLLHASMTTKQLTLRHDLVMGNVMMRCLSFPTT
jgi:hypothetical protein